MDFLKAWVDYSASILVFLIHTTMAALASTHLKGMARDEFKVQEGLGTVPSVVAAVGISPS